MKPAHIKCQRQKEIRSIYKKRRIIWSEKRNLGLIELEKPIRHGWFKEIIITQKISKHKNKAAIKEVYSLVEKLFWGRNKEEAEKMWLFQTSKYLINKEIPTISKRQFNKLSDAAKYLCVPFYYKTESKKWKTRFYVKIPKTAYRIKFTKAYITHSKRIDPKLESKDVLLAQQLLKNGFYEANKKISSLQGLLENRTKKKTESENKRIR